MLEWWHISYELLFAFAESNFYLLGNLGILVLYLVLKNRSIHTSPFYLIKLLLVIDQKLTP